MYFYCFISLPLAVNFGCRHVRNKSVQETASWDGGWFCEWCLYMMQRRLGNKKSLSHSRLVRRSRNFHDSLKLFCKLFNLTKVLRTIALQKLLTLKAFKGSSTALWFNCEYASKCFCAWFQRIWIHICFSFQILCLLFEWTKTKAQVLFYIKQGFFLYFRLRF